MTKLLHSRGIWWFFACLTLFVYFYGLGIPLLGPDEPRYAQVAREMWQTGDWITPTLGGHNWFEKPALLYWLQIVAFNIFGVTEFAARFGSALFGLGTIAALWIATRFSNAETQSRGEYEFANWTALVAASTLGILVFSRAASFDVIVTFPLTASLAGFFVFDQTRENENKKQFAGLFAFYFFAGLAMLAKGLIGIIFPFAIAAFYFVISKRFPSRRFLFSLVWGTAIIVAVAAVWNLPMYLKYGWEFIDEFYVQHHFQRFTSNKYRHPQPFYFFFWVLPLMTLPWLPFFLAEMIRSLRKFFQRKDSETQNQEANSLEDLNPLRIFAFAWMLVPLVFFSVSGSKLPGYILPALPGAVILAALYIFDFVQKSDARKYAVFGVAFSTFAVIIGLLTFVVPKYADADSVKRLIETADAKGYSTSKVANFKTLSHSAEFYAAGRLLRDANGEQLRFDEFSKLKAAAQIDGQPLLVLTPMKDMSTFTNSNFESLADNGVLAIGVLSGIANNE